jgi:hypothetical protein
MQTRTATEGQPCRDHPATLLTELSCLRFFLWVKVKFNLYLGAMPLKRLQGVEVTSHASLTY